MGYGKEIVIDGGVDGIKLLAKMMGMAGLKAEDVMKSIQEFVGKVSFYIGRTRVKHPHPRHKQIERARAMMKRRQKGK